jgi:hypothetical protein
LTGINEATLPFRHQLQRGPGSIPFWDLWRFLPHKLGGVDGGAAIFFKRTA